MADAVCIDASVALLWVLPDDLTPAARSLRRLCHREGVSIIAPPLFRAEVTSTVRRWLYSGRVTEAFAREAVRRSLNFPVMIEGQFDSLQLRAFDLATALNQPRAYDSQYLALAEFCSCQLWTADERFVNSARDRFPNVRWIGELQARVDRKE